MSVRGTILGLGRRGEMLASFCLKAGWEVRAFDPAPLAAAAEARLDGLRRSDTISSAVRHADWVFCCLPDRIELIQKVMQRAQYEAPDNALMAVVSSSYDIETIQSCAMRPSQVFRISMAGDGACTLDMAERNPEDARRRAKRVAEDLAAVGSLFGLHDSSPPDEDAESA